MTPAYGKRACLSIYYDATKIQRETYGPRDIAT
jgi:hypothetical protein